MFPKVSHMGLVFSLLLSLWACRSDNATGDTVVDAVALPHEENDLFEPEDLETSDRTSGDITEDRDRHEDEEISILDLAEGDILEDSTPPLPENCALDSLGDSGLVLPPLLSFDLLMSDIEPESPVDNSAFAMPAHALAPLHQFEGRLELHDEASGEMDTHFSDWWIAPGQDSSTLPDIDLTFVQCGRHIIPSQRGRIITEDPYWDLFVSPGLTWSTPYDEGMSRAAIPFALGFKTENCLQNGVMSFLYDDETVSKVRYQVTQETCPWLIFDLWGQSQATYSPETVDDKEGLQADLLAELLYRYPTKPLSELALDFPGVSLDALDIGQSLDSITARGVWVEGTLYLDDCRTRFGNYPFCETVALPSYSLSKTLFMGLTMAAVALEFPTDPYTLLVSDYLPDEVAEAPGSWETITFEHLIDMTTGHYRNANQNDDYMGTFFTDVSLVSRLWSSFLYPYQEPPGERTVYLTPNFQVAAAALDAYLVSIDAPITDSFEYAVDRIFRPAGLPPDSYTSLRTWEDGGQNNGTAFGGYGMLLTPQGTSRIGRFLLDGGTVDGEPVLHTEKLQDTMFQNLSDTGAPMYYYDWSYNNAMWGYPLDAYGCTDFVPTLFGVSGITVMLAPNDVIYFSYNDTVEYPITNILDQLDAISPLCP